MKLGKFIKQLEGIQTKHGGNIDVVMADYIPVVEPNFQRDENVGDSVIITDEK